MLKEIFEVTIALIVVVGSLVITTMSYGIELLLVMLFFMAISATLGFMQGITSN